MTTAWSLNAFGEDTTPLGILREMNGPRPGPDCAEVPPPVVTEVIPEGGSCGGVMDQNSSNIPVQRLGRRSSAFTDCRLSSIEARCRHMHEVIDRYLNA